MQKNVCTREIAGDHMGKVKRSRLWLLWIAACFIGVFYYGIDVSSTVRHASSYIIYPVVRLQHMIIHPLKRWVERKNAIQQLGVMVEKYQKQNHDLLAEIIASQASLHHCNDIKELVEFQKRYEQMPALFAQILTRQFSDEAHFFLIDRGANAQVEVDMVALYKNCLVGRVVEVYPWYSKVLLVTDHQCKVPAVSVINNARGIYTGVNTIVQGSFQYVSHLEKLNLDELIISSGEGLVFPKGFGLGKIKAFEVNNTDYTYTVSVEPLLDLRAIEYCYLVRKGSEFPLLLTEN